MCSWVCEMRQGITRWRNKIEEVSLFQQILHLWVIISTWAGSKETGKFGSLLTSTCPPYFTYWSADIGESWVLATFPMFAGWARPDFQRSGSSTVSWHYSVETSWLLQHWSVNHPIWKEEKGRTDGLVDMEGMEPVDSTDCVNSSDHEDIILRMDWHVMLLSSLQSRQCSARRETRMPLMHHYSMFDVKVQISMAVFRWTAHFLIFPMWTFWVGLGDLRCSSLENASKFTKDQVCCIVEEFALFGSTDQVGYELFNVCRIFWQQQRSRTSDRHCYWLRQGGATTPHRTLEVHVTSNPDVRTKMFSYQLLRMFLS